MIHRIGDKVRVKKNLEKYKTYGKHFITNEMFKLVGKTVTITNVTSSYYRIKEDEERWCWSEEMLERVEYTYRNLEEAPIRN